MSNARKCLLATLCCVAVASCGSPQAEDEDEAAVDLAVEEIPRNDAPVAAAADSTAPEWLKELRDPARQEAQMRTLRELQGMMSEAHMRFEREHTRCLDAFGHEDFCDCLRSDTAGAHGFYGYVKAVTMTRTEIESANLTSEERGWLEKARAGRDKCVATTVRATPPTTFVE